jgi:cytochrome bd-type quinol oxidase subunit 2
MKPEDNTATSLTSGTLTAHIEQPVQETEQKDLTVNFFVVGGVINIMMILAYFIWAFFQWKKIDKRNKEQ